MGANVALEEYACAPFNTRSGFSILLLTANAFACPVCDTPTGVEVREGIFNEQFWRNTLLTLAPFPIIAERRGDVEHVWHPGMARKPA